MTNVELRIVLDRERRRTTSARVREALYQASQRIEQLSQLLACAVDCVAEDDAPCAARLRAASLELLP